MEEVWRDIRGYEGLYQISNYGRIKSLKRKWTSKDIIKTPSIDRYGYPCISISNGHRGTSVKKSIHRIVCETFIPNPNNLPQVNHKDENKTNNFVWVNDDGTIDMEKSNLEWCDAKYNINYGNGISKRQKSVLQFTKDEEFVKEWESITKASRTLKIPHSNIVQCCRGDKRHHSAGGFIWRYAS